MTFIAIDPKSKKVKEYPHSGAWLDDVEKHTAEPKEQAPKNEHWQARFRRETGIDLRSRAEKERAKLDEAVGKAVSEALARQQAIQAPTPAAQTHTRPLFTNTVEEAIAKFRAKQQQQKCNSAHGQHSAYATGPVMTAQIKRA